MNKQARHYKREGYRIIHDGTPGFDTAKEKVGAYDVTYRQHTVAVKGGKLMAKTVQIGRE